MKFQFVLFKTELGLVSKCIILSRIVMMMITCVLFGSLFRQLDNNEITCITDSALRSLKEMEIL